MGTFEELGITRRSVELEGQENGFVDDEFEATVRNSH